MNYWLGHANQNVMTHEKGLQKEENLVLVKGDISKRNGKLLP
jgi:predicted phosphohydrolase